jgi:hypothetical protein
VPAAGEEIFFRGFLGRGLVARWGIARGILLTSLLFGALHFHPVQSVTAILGGTVGHLLYLGCRSLWAPIIKHALHNSMLLVFGAFGRGALEALSRTGHLPPLLLVAAATAIAILGILLYRTHRRWLLPDGTKWSPGYDTAEMPPAAAGARLHSAAPSRNLVAVAAVIYSTFVAILVWKLMRQ